MDTDQIDQMPAGIELDILITEALGYTRIIPFTARAVGSPVFKVVSGGCSLGDNDKVYIRRDTGDFVLFAPSTDIAAAFQVVDKLLDGTRVFALESYMPRDEGWQAMFKGELDWEAARYEQLVYAYAETRPLAICRAALKVMEHKDESTGADCQHEFFKCQVPAGDSCVAIYHQVCRKCRWDKRKGIYMPLNIWQKWAVPQLEKLQNCSGDEK